MKKARVFCESYYDFNNEQAYQDFYLTHDGRDYFLFRQEYRKGIKEYFGRGGVDIDRAIKNNWNKLDTAVIRTIDKIPSYIRYIEKQYGIAVLEQTKKRRLKYA